MIKAPKHTPKKTRKFRPLRPVRFAHGTHTARNARVFFDINGIKNKILGKHYELSFAFVSKNKIRELNRTYRDKDEPTDILSFPLDKSHGEILICKEIAKKKSKDFGLTFDDYLVFLIIHGCLHLKGLVHGSRMEKLEEKYCKIFIKNKSRSATS